MTERHVGTEEVIWRLPDIWGRHQSKIEGEMKRKIHDERKWRIQFKAADIPKSRLDDGLNGTLHLP